MARAAVEPGLRPLAWEMRGRVALALAFVLLAALPFVLPLLGAQAVVGLATRMLIYAIAAASLNLILGYAGLVSFGHAAYYGVGAYVVGILYAHWASDEPLLGLVPGTDQFLLAVPAAVIVSGLAALVLGALSLRTSGVQFIMITLAFAQMLFFLFVSLDHYGGDDGLIMRRPNALLGLNLRDDATMYLVALGALALYLLLLSRIVRSRFGRVLSGIRQDERRVIALGIEPYPYKLAAFVIAGMGAGLAGALMANMTRFVSPDMLHWTKSGEFMIMVILGGVGSLFGPVLGAACLIGLEYVLAGLTEDWQFYLGPLLVLVVLFARGGLSGLLGRRAGVGGSDG
ncbi:branched-chain amino acid ABC transporter permease [Arenibaculum pallidiluteum]|uniref:branched-chain amino acid ABC transporter permease n=1 Tax=Arenibaculum pallidiluteum TaxID=2812559 RepID=UPI001F2213D0|nr:branched-chain amino acid ABC transporter permease [Arenibaculum pallidiluteum]